MIGNRSTANRQDKLLLERFTLRYSLLMILKKQIRSPLKPRLLIRYSHHPNSFFWVLTRSNIPKV